MNVKDLTGQRFGRLIALHRTDERHGNCYLWLCQCDCGKQVKVSTYYLTHKIKQSCGCLQIESRHHDVTNQRFGRLVAIAPTKQVKNHSVVWECLCDCGNTTTTRLDTLISGDKQSCGCLAIETKINQANAIRAGNHVDSTNVGCIAAALEGVVFKNNTSGVRGVSWHKGMSKWQARITFQGKTISLGYHDDIADAAAARKEAEQKYFDTYLESNSRLL